MDNRDNLQFETDLETLVPGWFAQSPKLMLNAVYNFRVSQMLNLLRRPYSVLCLLLASFFAISAWAGDWSAPEQELVRKIVAVTGPGAVALEVVNRSSLGPAEVDAIRSALRNQLNAAGLTFVNPDQAVASVQVSLSENLRTHVWIARIQQGNNPPATEIVSWPRMEPGTPVHEPSVLVIRKIQLWAQDERIVDVAVIDTSPPRIIVLNADQLALYSLQNGRWQTEETFPISHTRPWPRDLRGRLMLSRDHLFDAYLPGVFCSSTATSPLKVSCHDRDDPWPVASEQTGLKSFFSPTRNFFTGALAPGIGQQSVVPPFYSAASLPRDKYVLWVMAGVDGQIRQVDGMNVQTIFRPSWGSDIASVKTGCGSGTQVLVSSSSEGSAPDTIRAFEFPDRDPVAVSQPLELGGSIISLWTEASGSTAVAVVQHQETGKYEAFRLTISCGQ
jgi:hypothetical protein